MKFEFRRIVVILYFAKFRADLLEGQVARIIDGAQRHCLAIEPGAFFA